MAAARPEPAARPADAAPAAGPPPAPPPKVGALRAVVENVEALAIAIVMALILKYFLIEAYKIPTGSMQPGIMGDPHTEVFDRVLVSKLVYLMREPRRYEVVVFKNPLWQRQNYIKRLVGFENERVTLRNGDIFITPAGGAGAAQHDGDGGGGGERIARKPDSVWHYMRKEIVSRDELDSAYDHAFLPEAGMVDLAQDRIELKPGPAATASIVLAEPVRDEYFDGYATAIVEAHATRTVRRFNWNLLGWLRNLSWWEHVQRTPPPRPQPTEPEAMNAVTDVELAATVTPREGTQEVAFEIRESGRVHRAVLPIGRGKVRVTPGSTGGTDGELEPGAAGELDAWLPAGRATRVSFRNVDDELVLEIGGETVVRVPYVTRGLDPTTDPRTRQRVATRVAVVATGGGVTLEELTLSRDIHYLADGQGSRSSSYIVPPGRYMVLGDNTQNSWDCRVWQKATYQLKDGTRIEGNYFSPGPRGYNADSNPNWTNGAFYFRNVYGEEYAFPRAAIAGDPTDPDTEAVHSFPKDFLLGKALAVFWPLPPFAPTWRLKWVH